MDTETADLIVLPPQSCPNCLTIVTRVRRSVVEGGEPPGLGQVVTISEVGDRLAFHSDPCGCEVRYAWATIDGEEQARLIPAWLT